jgi:heme A synthase
VFLVAGIYGVLVVLPQYSLEARIARDFPPPITHPEYFYGFIGVALAWQVAFLLIARDVQRYRLVMLPAILEKVTFGVATVLLYANARVAVSTLIGGIVDLVFAALFALAFRATRGKDGSRP